MAIAFDHSYDYTCFMELVYEFDATQKEKIEKKIRQKLKYHKLGAYDAERVEYIRTLKNDLQAEIGLYKNSEYYSKSASEFTVMADFNMVQMTADYSARYNKIEAKDMTAIIGFALYYFYER
ncbi:hypothetical protein BH11BAC7_BH11BAC7_17630 [soil metagenome]